MKKLSTLFFLTMLMVFAAVSRADEQDMTLASGNVITYSRFPATGTNLLLWFSSERGFGKAERQAAIELSSKHVEVWLFDLASALFLPQTPSSLDSIKAEDMKSILSSAVTRGGNLCVYAPGRAAVPVLRGLSASPDIRARVLLMHPNFYSRVDALEGADYLDFGDLDSVDVLVLQPRRSAATPWVENQVEALRMAGANTAVMMLERLREGFWVREDATDYEVSEAKNLSERILNWMKGGK
jgi:hypothetical protein